MPSDAAKKRAQKKKEAQKGKARKGGNKAVPKVENSEGLFYNSFLFCTLIMFNQQLS